MTDAANLDAVARAICRERCAVYGEPPCHTVDGYDGTDCADDAPCRVLAQAALDVITKQNGAAP